MTNRLDNPYGIAKGDLFRIQPTKHGIWAYKSIDGNRYILDRSTILSARRVNKLGVIGQVYGGGPIFLFISPDVVLPLSPLEGLAYASLDGKDQETEELRNSTLVRVLPLPAALS